MDCFPDTLSTDHTLCRAVECPQQTLPSCRQYDQLDRTIKSLYVDQEASLHLLRKRKERAQRKERKQSLKALGEATDDSIRNDEMNRVGGSWDTNGYFGARGEIKLLEELKNVCNRLVQDHDVKLSNSLMFSMVEAHISE